MKSESEVVQSCLTLGDSMDCSLPSSSIPWDFPGKNTGVGCHFLLQGISPTQGLKLGLQHCRQMLYHLRHQGNPSGPINHSIKKKKNIYIYIYIYTHTHTLFNIPDYRTFGSESAWSCLMSRKTLPKRTSNSISKE